MAGKFYANLILQKGQPDFKSIAEVVRAVYELEAPHVPTSPELRLPTAELPEETIETAGTTEGAAGGEPSEVKVDATPAADSEPMQMDNVQHEGETSVQSASAGLTDPEGVYMYIYIYGYS